MVKDIRVVGRLDGWNVDISEGVEYCGLGQSELLGVGRWISKDAVYIARRVIRWAEVCDIWVVMGRVAGSEMTFRLGIEGENFFVHTILYTSFYAIKDAV